MAERFEDLTRRQREVLEMIISFFDDHGVGPSFRDIGSAMGISSTNGVSDHIQSLKTKGYLEQVGGRGAARSIRLTSKARGALDDGDTIGVPVLGRIAAGVPIEAQEEEEARLRIDRGMLPAGADLFALRVRGESMIEDGILDGDIVFVRAQSTCRDGDIAAVLVEGEATIKRLYRERNHLRLEPSNASMAPINVPADVGEVRVMGRVVGLWRQMS